MTTKGKILIIFFTLLIGEIGTTAPAYNPLWTYIIRVRNFIFLPNVFGNYTFNNYKTTNEYINIHYLMKIPSNIKHEDINAITIFNRCDLEGINCEYFQTWKLSVCRILNEKNELWDSFISAIHPTPKCPLKEYYQVINVSLEIGPIVNLYPQVTQYQWKLLIKYQVDNFFLGGFKLDASIFGYRKRIKKLLIV